MLYTRENRVNRFTCYLSLANELAA